MPRRCRVCWTSWAEKRPGDASCWSVPRSADVRTGCSLVRREMIPASRPCGTGMSPSSGAFSPEANGPTPSLSWTASSRRWPPLRPMRKSLSANSFPPGSSPGNSPATATRRNGSIPGNSSSRTTCRRPTGASGTPYRRQAPPSSWRRASSAAMPPGKYAPWAGAVPTTAPPCMRRPCRPDPSRSGPMSPAS